MVHINTMTFRNTTLWPLFFLYFHSSTGFVPTTFTSKGSSSSKLYSDNNNVNGEALVALGDARASLLNSAFEALDENDQYDAVLTGICSKIIDGKISTNPEQVGKEATMTQSQLAMELMKDPLRLVNEMNQRRVKASTRSLMALIDAAGSTQDAKVISNVLSCVKKNGSLSFYGSLQSSIQFLPSTSNSPILQKGITRAERLEKLRDIPSDDRAKEVSAAITTMGLVGVCLIVQGIGNGIGLEEVTPYTSFILSSIVGIGIIDNFFDVLKTSGSMLMKMSQDKLPDAVQNVSIPEKESMPFGLGKGEITGTVVRGLTRLWAVDTERECQCEAAAFFAAYSLGLPCFAFQPNALEAAILMFESNKKDDDVESSLDPLLSSSGLMKVLIWLLAPVAYESMFHPQLIASDPREAMGLLIRLKEKSAVFKAEDTINSLLRIGEGSKASEEEMEDLLKWAYAEADSLLRNNNDVVQTLSERLIGGASTLGDCAALLEDWE